MEWICFVGYYFIVALVCLGGAAMVLAPAGCASAGDRVSGVIVLGVGFLAFKWGFALAPFTILIASK